MQGLFVVTTDVVPGRQAEELAEWYATVHFPDLLAVPGVVSAQLLESMEGLAPRFLAVYGIEGDDLDEVMSRIRAGTPQLRSAGRLFDGIEVHMARAFARRHCAHPAPGDAVGVPAEPGPNG